MSPSPPKPTFPPTTSQSLCCLHHSPYHSQHPSPSYSLSISPASSASPPTSPGIKDHTAKIISASSSPGLATGRAEAMPLIHSKSKMFAFASPAMW
ncbi:hypothetical protein JVT61DRAFT_13353 [Boletus reticuloceps]|uniref:Uncharacterized protein n=1 Tax=Boletus reticuloceps TaxID=495285 RepID=A0A8I2YDA9_9AGAM|nr:hypothetical protein JVT61DRAFT_13353 [Boletus reticuloceps]